MQNYLLTTIARDVRIAIDQNMQSTMLEGFSDVDTLALNDIIQSKVVEAVARVHNSAPAVLLSPKDITSSSPMIKTEPVATGEKLYYMVLPSDFMRFVALRMSDWSRTLYEAIDIDDAKYLHQSSRFAGIRGCAQKPVAALVPGGDGLHLELYPHTTGGTVKLFLYMPYPKIENGSIAISERCYQAVVYTIAYMVLLTIGNAEQSNALAALAKSALIYRVEE